MARKQEAFEKCNVNPGILRTEVLVPTGHILWTLRPHFLHPLGGRCLRIIVEGSVLV